MKNLNTTYTFTEEELDNLLEQVFNAGSDMISCDCEFDYLRRGYEPFDSYEDYKKQLDL